LVGVKAEGLGAKNYLSVRRVRNQELVYPQLEVDRFKEEDAPIPLMGDLFIELM
jgi:hypothetical protein